VGGDVAAGWGALAAALPRDASVVAVDGPAIANWPQLVAGLSAAFEARGVTARFQDTMTCALPWPRIKELTSSAGLRDDRDFEKLADGTLADLFDLTSPAQPSPGSVLVVLGPGAALLPHDVLCYADLPKRYAEAAVAEGRGRNLGQPADAGPGTTKRLFYVDWPLLDRHRDAISGRIDHWIDMQDPDAPALIGGAALRTTLAGLVVRPFRTRPTFNTTSWGGHWAQRELGHNPQARNTALGYELIAPESGVLIGTGPEARVEIPFQLVVALHPRAVLGDRVHEVFATSFPIRFDYLDTVDGGSLSVHCHPRSDYMRDVFGWPYPQHETYYMMVGGEDREVYLGLRGDADIESFHSDAHEADDQGTPFEIAKYVQTFPASKHQLFLIPAGTPHGSGKGNVVLEVSATPYLYSLRFYDWLRHDVDGNQRPVHVEHAFRNLNRERRGDAVAQELVPRPEGVRAGEDWHEELIGALPEMFFEVRRMVLRPDAVADDDTEGRFHVLNVVEGDGVLLETPHGDHELGYAETLVVPAAVGHYSLRALGSGDVAVVKAVVR
jgi:mannose-6-phosphate isomerase class I